MDIGGAYLHAGVGKNEVYIIIPRDIAEIFIKINPELKRYRDSRGNINAKRLKAFYGCQDSALLFFKHMTKSLLRMNLVQYKYDQCIFNLISK